jgi:hypothetical protein
MSHTHTLPLLFPYFCLSSPPGSTRAGSMARGQGGGGGHGLELGGARQRSPAPSPPQLPARMRRGSEAEELAPGRSTIDPAARAPSTPTPSPPQIWWLELGRGARRSTGAATSTRAAIGQRPLPQGRRRTPPSLTRGRDEARPATLPARPV